jgi:hypothetical protein
VTIDILKIDDNRDGHGYRFAAAMFAISNCTVNSPWDDATGLKSSYALGEARATEM